MCAPQAARARYFPVGLLEAELTPDWLRPIVCVDVNTVNIEDLIDCGYGKGTIVRVHGNVNDAVRFIYPEGSHDFVAAYVSENP